MMWWLLGLWFGCGSGNLAAECNQVIAVTNQNIAALSALTKDDVQGTHLTHMEQAATTAATQARALAGDLRSRDLREHSLRYAELSSAVALQSEMLADRMASAAAMEQAAAALDSSLNNAISALTLLCQNPQHSAGCTEAQRSISALPNQFGNDMLQQVTTLRDLGTAHPALRQPLTNLSNTLQQAAALHARIASAHATIEEAQQAMVLLDQGQAALVADLNQTCM